MVEASQQISSRGDEKGDKGDEKKEEAQPKGFIVQASQALGTILSSTITFFLAPIEYLVNGVGK